MDNIKSRWPDAEIVGLGIVREDPSRTVTWPISHKRQSSKDGSSKVKATLKDRAKSCVSNSPFALRFLRTIYRLVQQPIAVIQELFFAARSFREIRSFDVIVLSAGDQFAESVGRHRLYRSTSWKFPYTIFKWMLLARMARVRTILLNVSSGRNSGITRLFVDSALSLADCVSFRDEKSRRQFPPGTSIRQNFVFPDPMYSQDVTAFRNSEEPIQISRVVGLAPMILGDPSPLLDSYLYWVADFASWLMKHDYHVRLFCSNINVDSGALCRLQDIVAANNGDQNAVECLDRVHQWSTHELLVNMSSLDYVVTSRFHGVVFAQLLAKPVLAISNHNSVRTLMNDSGLAEYFVNVDSLDSNALREGFMSMVTHRNEIKNRMAKQVAFLREKLATDFDQIFPREVSRGVRTLHSEAAALLAK